MNETGLPEIQHLAIIMDGNGRWAERQGLPRTDGHKAGAETVTRVLKYAKEFNIKYLTLYAFSTENWKRSAAEVAALMKLLEEFTTKRLDDMMREDVRLNAIGRLDDLPLPARMGLKKAMEATRNNRSGVLTLALNYGGRAELVDAVKKIVSQVEDKSFNIKDLDEKSFAGFLYDPELPDPELMIRTSGELRLSNFLLWELAYSEIFVTDTLWPDFDRADLVEALSSYGKRERRFGGVIKK